MISPRKRIKVIQKLSEIERGRLSCRKGKLSYRELTEEEEAEVAALRESIRPKFSDEEFSLFSRVVEDGGGTVIEKVPVNREEIRIERDIA